VDGWFERAVVAVVDEEAVPQSADECWAVVVVEDVS
jgi:hypothetical protein